MPEITKPLLFIAIATLLAGTTSGDWKQLQGNAQRSGDAPAEVLLDDLDLIATVPTTDAILASLQ